MSRLKTDKERQDKRARQRKERKIRKGNPYVKTVTNPVDIKALTPECTEFVLSNMKRGWITRNTRCPCNSGKRFKNCCMKLRRPDEKKEVSSSARLDQVTH